jgi:hypothetical protein
MPSMKHIGVIALVCLAVIFLVNKVLPASVKAYVA